MLIITRNDHDYGPFDEREVARYVEEGRLLLHDKARDADTGREGIVRDFLMAKGLRPHVRNNGTLGQQLDYVGREFIFPRESMRRTNLFEDKRMLILAVVGLSLSFIMMMPVVIVTTATLVIVIIKWKLMLQFIQIFISMQFVIVARSFCVFHSYAPMFSNTIISQFRQLSTKYEKNFTFLF